ncbi:MAG: serine protease [Termitinemataceae bacterium]|nr:MAG: serine protease [Termitinemataceae bacterium]
MKKLSVCAVLFITFNVATVFAQSSNIENISKGALKLIQAAVFEVVIDKAPDTRLTYDKEIDMENVPFKIRSDKYESIGTAFAISKTEVATAFHVIDLAKTSLVYKKYYIRDSNGIVNEIDKITSASNERDIITCTVKDRTFPTFLRFAEKWNVGDTAFTVGNALGEGIVVRQGLILGTEPEPIKGRWNILKTSADSSPGNSGGPLMTSDGSVLGVVVSRKDNIQYTVPSKVINSTPKDKLIYYAKPRLSHAILANKLSVTYEDSVQLPAAYDDVRKKLCVDLYNQYVTAMEKLFSQAPEYLTGEDSLYLLTFSPESTFPEVDFVNPDTDAWALSGLEKSGVKLPDDGQLTSAKLSDFTVTRIQKPRTANLTTINTDPKYIFDLILKNRKTSRKFFGDDYRVISYGNPYTLGKYKDAQGKTWITTEWLIDYADQIQISYILPLPSGPVIVSTVQYTSNRDMYQWDIKKICDHIHAVYTSNFDNWSEYLSNTQYVPDFLKDFKFNWNKDAQQVTITSNEFSLAADNRVFDWTSESEFLLTFCYYKTSAGISYDIDYLVMQHNAVKNDYFSFRRNFKPDDGLGRKALDRWDTLQKKAYPFDGKAYISTEDNTGSIGGVFDASAKNDDSMFSIYMRLEEPSSDADLKKRFDILKNSIVIK